MQRSNYKRGDKNKMTQSKEVRESIQRIETKKMILFKSFAKRVKQSDNTTYRIILEGNDGLGKSTIAEKFKVFFESLGLSVKCVHFPIYSNYTGKCLKELYTNKGPDERHPEIDLFLHKANIREYMYDMVERGSDKNEYDVIIIDRSPISNFLYHATLPLKSKYSTYSNEQLDAITDFLYYQYQTICGDEMKLLHFNCKHIVSDKIFLVYGDPPKNDRENEKNDLNINLQQKVKALCEFIDRVGYDCFGSKLYTEFYIDRRTFAYNTKGKYISDANLIYSVLYSLFFDELTSS